MGYHKRKYTELIEETRVRDDVIPDLFELANYYGYDYDDILLDEVLQDYITQQYIDEITDRVLNLSYGEDDEKPYEK